MSKATSTVMKELAAEAEVSFSKFAKKAREHMVSVFCPGIVLGNWILQKRDGSAFPFTCTALQVVFFKLALTVLSF